MIRQSRVGAADAYARSGGVHLAYQVLGEGERDIVLVLDWTSHLEAIWEQAFVEDFLSSLTRFARVLWFDMRGVGLSDRVLEEAVAPEEWMEDVGAVMEAAGSEQATLIAHGHAAQMALMFAATHPDRVTSLVLINGFARLSRADDYPAGMPICSPGDGPRGTRSRVGNRRHGIPPRTSVAERPGVQDWYGKVERYAASPGTAVAKMRAVLELDVRNVLPLVSVPTLVVQNRDDALVRAAMATTSPNTSKAHACSSEIAPTTGPSRSRPAWGDRGASSPALVRKRATTTGCWPRS